MSGETRSTAATVRGFAAGIGLRRAVLYVTLCTMIGFYLAPSTFAAS